MSHVFVSYAHKDQACADRIVNRLEAQGIPVWIDKYSIPGGEWWGPAIQEGIRHATVILVLWSQNAKSSDHVRDEIKWSLQEQAQHPAREVQIIPVLLEPFSVVGLPENLAGLHAIDLTECEAYQSFKPLLHHLLDLEGICKIKRRPTTGFDKTKLIGDLPETKLISTSANLWIAPVMQSVHCTAYLAGQHDTCIADLSPKTAQLCFLMKGTEGDHTFLEQVRAFVGEHFLALYVTPKLQGGVFELKNQRQGQWLDIVNTSHEAALHLFGRGGATLQVFALAPTVLTFAIGTRFYEYWNLQFFNRVDQSYMMVMDNSDLPFKV